ncbi:zf-HC2 domain-containing protein [Micromonospora narathiwatensis]|uniref:Predicted anti-sigma-YlaC factor YlaD, contains Zn-finger domain n=1 Tax=Micromonospora narathiwatensis TaxID=299146 RepID=A0A1A9ADK8_9ACTN|nr:zf-HC2 domain-containing protein [Micromonospora narathiwatensis]SBT54250.1 Predicted anti-sigma-YlaC factor YlaD, contains Zn-finger domain [Micromonospora narathiwatensis]
MGCEQWREVLSALLDGEETAAERVAAEAHLSGCGGCRAWYDRAAAVTRRARLSVTVAGDDLTDVILAALPEPVPVPPAEPEPVLAPRRRGRIVLTLRAVLGLIGALQVVLGLTQIGRGVTGVHDHAAAGALASGHLWHESAAWNVAVGAGFLFVAARRTPPTGLVPMLSAFVGTLVLLSVNDLATERVETTRLVSHGFLLAGYAVVVALSRPRLRPGGPAQGDRPEGPRWHLPAEEQPDAPGLRLLPPPYPGSARTADRWAA